jgi:hypothetical protein
VGSNRWSFRNIVDTLFVWTAGLVFAGAICAVVLQMYTTAVSSICISLGLVFFSKLFITQTLFVYNIEIDMSDFRTEKFIEATAQRVGHFYLSLEGDNSDMYASVRYNPIAFKEFYEIVKRMQENKVKVFVTNEPTGTNVGYIDIRYILREGYKQYEHVLALDAVLEIAGEGTPHIVTYSSELGEQGA